MCIRDSYESVPYHNAVFVGKDESGKARYAFLRGIYEKNGKGFKMEQTGSEKKYSFCIPPERETKRVAVYEACIDALAHMTLEEGKRDKYRLSLGAVSYTHLDVYKRQVYRKRKDRILSPVPKSIPTEWKLCGTGIGQ